MKNNKGFLYALPWIAGGLAVIVAGVCIWHIPAWEKAKAKGCESSYQQGNYACGSK